MTIHERSEEYLDTIIQQKFSSAYMSDSKWVKLVSKLVENSAVVKECRVKPIWDEKEPTRTLKIQENIQYDFDYYDSAMEAMVSGSPTGWYAYKEIEWLDFPRFVYLNGAKKNQKNDSQDLELIKRLIEEVGQFYLEPTDNNLRLYAYLKRQ